MMNVAISAPAVAPQTTGHPASLPPDPGAVTDEKKVAPAEEKPASSDAEAQTSGQDASAPPSAIQRKIMEILERQAEAQETV